MSRFNSFDFIDSMFKIFFRNNYFIFCCYWVILGNNSFERIF